MRRARLATRKKRAFSALLVAVFAAGCGGVGPSVADRPNTLVTMGFGLPDEHATARVAVFKSHRPEVDLRINEGVFDEQQFLSSVAAGDPPDLVYADRRKLGGYAARGAVQDLGPCLAQRHVDLADYRQAAVRQVTYEGTVYGVPDFFTVRVLILNNPVLRANGVDPARVSTTDWNALAEVAAKLSRVENGRVGRIGFDPRVPEFVAMWAKANAVDLVGDEPHLDDPRVVEAVRYTTDLVREQGGWAAFKAFRDTFDSFGANNELVTGQVAAMAMDSWYVNTLAANSPAVDVTIAPLTDRRGDPLTEAGGQAWAIPKGSRHPELACEFIATMTAADTWVTAAKARRDALAKKGKPYSGTFTANRAADERIFAEAYDPRGIRVLEQGVQVLRSLQDKAFALPPSPAASDLVRSWEAAVTRVLLGQQQPEESMAQAQREAGRALTRVGGR
ncbi:ABC transporter substrate-binding protein [Nocardia sp. NRRL S-836]|uniref:ABC transporter substrate-binding protein n=1 Tax=Nocardia sp. NRRL S-836 TaxID=1519492 RepID=UPI0006C19886|nr:extracellular solute-binding protein [Nocardia sp. NRRL S-836]KOV90020.1 sugar ABC transporter substrate-binding protein [Nocardia sp. NRRL S-836]